MEIGISRVYNVLMVLKWRKSEKREPILCTWYFFNYNFVRDNAISDSCSLRNWQKWIFCRHGPEDWVRLSGGDYG